MKQILLLTAALVVTALPSPLRAAERPNIIFVLFDDMGWGQPPSYNPESKLRTPNLDKLASQRANEGGPFFLYFPMCPPHTPVVPAPDFVGKSGERIFALPVEGRRPSQKGKEADKQVD